MHTIRVKITLDVQASLRTPQLVPGEQSHCQLPKSPFKAEAMPHMD